MNFPEDQARIGSVYVHGKKINGEESLGKLLINVYVFSSLTATAALVKYQARFRNQSTRADTTEYYQVFSSP